LGSDREDNARPEGVAVESLPRAVRDAIDLSNEIAGRDVGRARRFLSAEEDIKLKDKEREKERAFNALMRALQDPAYAKLYNEAKDTVTRAEDAANRALDKLAQDSIAAEEKLQSIRDAAAELPDGRKAFRAKDGRIYAEDGSDVTEHAQSVKGLTDNAPSWEDYTSARDKLEDIERRRREVEQYRRDVLDPARHRLEDKENPPSPEELRDIIARTKGAMTPDVRAGYEEASVANAVATPKKNSAAEAYVSSTELNAPELLIDFASAHNGPAAENLAAAPTPVTTPKAS
jgi:hypothetical protein